MSTTPTPVSDQLEAIAGSLSDYARTARTPTYADVQALAESIAVLASAARALERFEAEMIAEQAEQEQLDRLAASNRRRDLYLDNFRRNWGMR